MRLTPLEPWIAAKAGAPGALTRAHLAAYQLAKLNETLALARSRSAFYREHFAGLPEGLGSLDQLADFPFTTADDIRQNPLRFVCTSQGDIARVVTLDSSGTTGEPKRLYFTRADQELTIDFFHVGMSTFTGPGDRVMILLPCERPGSVGDLLAIALERLEAAGIRHGLVRDPAETLAVMRRERVTGLVGIPAQVIRLVRGAAARGGPTPALHSALLTTDHVPHAIKRAVEAAWGCTVYNHYGMTEMGLGGGVECAARRGYHLREADLLFEVIDPATGRPVSEGVEGEVVVTTLTRAGMPLIRYRTGDVSRFIPGPCPCGAQLKTLARVRARLAGRAELPGGQALTRADLDEALFANDAVLGFSADLRGEWDSPTLHVAAEVDAPAGDPAALARPLRDAIRSIPALQKAHVDVRVTAAPEGAMPGAVKRTLGDSRRRL